MTRPTLLHAAASVVVLTLLASSGVSAQRPRTIRPQASRLFTRPDSVATSSARDYHLAGGLIGAGTVGILGALIGYDVCSTSDTPHGSCVGNALGLGLAGAVVGWVTGNLIGGLIPKGP